MNHLFKSMNVQYHRKYSRIYFNGDERRQSVELGPAVRLLQDKEFIKYNKRSRQFRFNGDEYGHTLFSDWNGSSAIDISKLKNYRDLRIKFNEFIRNHEFEVLERSFGNNDEQNRMLLAKGIDYIRTNYRNIVAHKEAVSKTKVTECKELLIQSEKLMWIIISALK